MVLEGWPNGLIRKAESGWPSYTYYPLARLLIEGNIKFRKVKKNLKVLEEIGPTKEDLHLALQKAEQAIIQKTRMVRKRDEVEGVDGEVVNPAMILSELNNNEAGKGREGRVTSFNIVAYSINRRHHTFELSPTCKGDGIDIIFSSIGLIVKQCHDPVIYEANIQFCIEHGLTSGNAKDGHISAKKFVSLAIIALMQDSGIRKLDGSDYHRQCPKGFLQVISVVDFRMNK